MKLLKTMLSGGLLMAVMPAAKGAKAEKSDLPNFIILFADDMGYGDIGVYGHPTIHTPNLDKMAQAGMASEKRRVLFFIYEADKYRDADGQDLRRI